MTTERYLVFALFDGMKLLDPAGPAEVFAEAQPFSSAILPAWARTSPQMTEVLPLLNLRGLSLGYFRAALQQFLSTAAELSAARSPD